MTADLMFQILDGYTGDEVYREGPLNGAARAFRVYLGTKPDGTGTYEEIAPDDALWQDVAARLKAAGLELRAEPIDRPWDGAWQRLQTVYVGTERTNASAVREDSR